MWTFQRPDAIAVLNDRLAKKSLARYFAVMQNQSPAKFLIAKKIPAEFNRSDSTEQLWREHARITEEFSRIQREIDEGRRDFRAMPTPEKSYLDLKIEIADRILSSLSSLRAQMQCQQVGGKVRLLWVWFGNNRLKHF